MTEINKTETEEASALPSVSRQVLYHETSEETANSILAHGFNDGWESWCDREGVWLSDGEYGFGTTTLIVLLSLTDRELAEYEVIHGTANHEEDAPDDDVKEHREWLIPAEVVAKYGTVHKLAD